jgi:molybdopterin-biosynthesis enzyme MoeA-like protein
MGVRRFGALIIGDELLRGKREDGHFARLRQILAARGLRLDWVLYAGDNRPRLTGILRRSLADDDVVFSFGGIGVTPDDHTRQAAAAAAGVPLVLHPDAEREIRVRMGEMKAEVTAARLELGTFPAGARIIPNPYNRIPGFSFADHHFLPGFPQMAWPMAEWVLDTYYPDSFNALAEAEGSLIVWEGLEGLLLGLMQRIEADYPGITVFSLPFLGSAEVRPNIELGVRGPPELVPRALAEIEADIVRRGLSFDRK